MPNIAMLALAIGIFLPTLLLATRLGRARWLPARILRALLKSLRLLSIVILVLGFRPFAVAFAETYPFTAVGVAVLGLVPAVRGRKTARARVLTASIGLVAIFTPVLIVWMSFFNIHYDYAADCAKVAEVPRIRLLFSQCQPGWADEVRKAIGTDAKLTNARHSRVTFQAADPDYLYLGTGLEENRDRDHVLVRLHVPTATVDRIYATSAVFGGGCDPETKRCLALLSADSAYLVIDDVTGAIVARGDLPARPRFAGIHDHWGMMALSGPPHVARVDLSTGEWSPPPAPVADAILANMGEPGYGYLGNDRAADDVFVCSDEPSMSTMWPEHLEPERIREWGRPGPIARVSFDFAHVRFGTLPLADGFWSLLMCNGLVAERDRNRLYFVATLAGEVLVLDYDTFEPRGRIPLAVGVRSGDLDRAGRRLFIPNYATGWMSVVDLESLREVDRLFVGRGGRWVEYDSRRDVVYVASRAGFLEVDVHGLGVTGTPVTGAPH